MDARVEALRRHAGCLLLALLALSCHDEGSVTDPPAWQFTGGIIFQLNGSSEASGICAIDPDEPSPKVHQLIAGAAEPKVSPNSQSVLQYRRPGSTADLFVSNLDGSDARNLTRTISDVSESDGDWSPDMQYVACHALFYPSYREALRLVRTDGSGWCVDLTDTARIRTVNYPRYSPQGDKIALIVQDTLYHPWWLEVISVDGMSRWRYQQSALVAPVWSPDGRRLAFARGTDFGLMILEISSGLGTVLDDGARAGPGIVWLTESTLIYGSIGGNLYDVKKASLSPSLASSSLASGFGSIDAILLSPRLDQLAIFGRREGETSLSLYLVALDGSGLRRVATVDPSDRASVTRNGYYGWVE